MFGDNLEGDTVPGYVPRLTFRMNVKLVITAPTYGSKQATDEADEEASNIHDKELGNTQSDILVGNVLFLSIKRYQRLVQNDGNGVV